MEMSVKEIVKKIQGMPLVNAIHYTGSRRKLLLVAKHLSDENAEKWPFLNPHKHCLRKIRQIETANGRLRGSELLNCYEDLASAYINNSSKW